jgi:hypothetical protein
MPVISKGSNHFQAVTYTGNGSTNTITGLSFKPDFVWIKGRSGATDHAIYDAVRGTTLDLASNTTAAETTQSTGLTSFNSDGFTLGALSKVNTNAATYVAWCWKGGNGTVSNTSGSITSTVSANTSAGFSVVTYAGNGSSSATVGHGLGVAPSMIILKNRTLARSWPVMHTSLPSNGNVFLDLTQAYQTTYATGGIANPANSTTFGFTTTSTLEQVNASGSNYVAYCFAPVAGYSAFGSYTGNGSADGPFVYTGFRPRWVLYKCSSTAATGWIVIDTSRDTYNLSQTYLQPNTSGAEGTSSIMDILSNGFKFRGITSTDTNASGGTYIYAAFCEAPFKYSLAR